MTPWTFEKTKAERAFLPRAGTDSLLWGNPGAEPSRFLKKSLVILKMKRGLWIRKESKSDPRVSISKWSPFIFLGNLGFAFGEKLMGLNGR